MEERLNAMKTYYNYNLGRFNKGCKYCEEHKDEVDKWLPELFRIYNKMNELLSQINEYENITSESIRNGFKI